MNLIETHWKKFRDSLNGNLIATNKVVLKNAWNSQPERTAFYTSKLLPQVAEDLKLVCETELCKVDFALCAKSTPGHKVPLIFIESENNAMTAADEMWKLCSLSAPLKVLISCIEWCEDPEYWPPDGKKGEKSRLLLEWKEIIKAHNEVWPQPCVYGIVIGELKENTLRFYSYGLGADGSELDPEGVLTINQLTHHFSHVGVSYAPFTDDDHDDLLPKTENRKPKTVFMKYRPLMILGSGSDVGKSIITAGLCRIFHQEGLRVAPFKAQNMALNSFITPEGGEMGRAQVVQAQAAGLAPHVDMNPILLKPSSEVGSQVIVHGQVYGNFSAQEYYRHKPRLTR